MDFPEAWSDSGIAASAVKREEAEILWIEARHAPERVVEIGSWHGRTAILLAHAVAPLGGHVHCVDPFDGSTGVGGTRFDDHHRGVLLYNLRARAPHGSWTYYRAHSAPLGRTWEGGKVSLLWVDGDHSEAGTLADWRAWVPNLAPGARVVLHDRHFPGPAAVIAAATSEGWKIASEAQSLVVLSR